MKAHIDRRPKTERISALDMMKVQLTLPSQQLRYVCLDSSDPALELSPHAHGIVFIDNAVRKRK